MTDSESSSGAPGRGRCATCRQHELVDKLRAKNAVQAALIEAQQRQLTRLSDLWNGFMPDDAEKQVESWLAGRFPSSLDANKPRTAARGVMRVIRSWFAVGDHQLAEGPREAPPKSSEVVPPYTEQEETSPSPSLEGRTRSV